MSDINITLTFPLSNDALTTAEALLQKVLGDISNLTTEQLQALELGMQVVGNEISRHVSIRKVLAERERIEEEKRTWTPDKKLGMSKWRQREIEKEKRSPKSKANEALLKLTGGELNITDFLMMAQVWCKEHKVVKTECGCK